jgi:hypothetical protein
MYVFNVWNLLNLAPARDLMPFKVQNGIILVESAAETRDMPD